MKKGNYFRYFGKREMIMFNKCMAGFLKAELLGKRIRFLTLTSSSVWSGLCWDDKKHFLYNDFRLLKLRLERDYGLSFGDYFRVATDEGNGAIHVVYAGDFIPRGVLVEVWNEVHGSHIVDIRYPRGNSFFGALYIIGQYMAGQDCKKVFGYSRDWVCKGFGKVYKDLVDLSRDYSVCYDNVYTGGFYYRISYDLLRRNIKSFVYRLIGVNNVVCNGGIQLMLNSPYVSLF